MIPTGVILLGSAWIICHLLIIPAVLAKGSRWIAMSLATVLLASIYLLKPYTYDLEKYSIFFVTGYIPTVHWHTPHGTFQLDPKDTTGDPYKGYEPGFSFFARLGSFILPAGSLWPRFNEDQWDLKNRGPPRHDGLLILIMLVSSLIIGFTIVQIILKSDELVKIEGDAVPLLFVTVVGSVFFFLGSQNAIRQFLGLVVLLTALNASLNKRHLTSVLLILAAATFHKWAIILGIITIFFTSIFSWQGGARESNRPFDLRLYLPEVLAVGMAVLVLGAVKLVLVFGAYHLDLPLIGDLKAYAIKQDQFQMFERPNVWIKSLGVIGLFVVSEIVAGKDYFNDKFDIRRMRRVVLLFIMPFVLLPEIFSRLLMLYWMIELIFIVWAVLSQRRRMQFAGVLVFTAYGFAPNALNVLLGPDWLHSF